MPFFYLNHDRLTKRVFCATVYTEHYNMFAITNVVSNITLSIYFLARYPFGEIYYRSFNRSLG